MKRILITGGAGFIGSHLCKRMLEEGNEVICLDNYFTGSKKNIVTYVTILPSLIMPRWTKYTILPVLLVLFIINIILSKR